MKFKRELVLWALAYVLLIGGMTCATFYARAALITQLDTPEAHENWKKWNDEAKKKDALVRKARGEPNGEAAPQPWRTRGDEHATLRILRDLFWPFLGIMYLVSTIVFVVFVLLLRGAMKTKSGPLSDTI